MNEHPRKITLDEWDERYTQLHNERYLRNPSYVEPLSRHVDKDGDFRLKHLLFDNSPAALRLWNFILSENDRLHESQTKGKKIVGAMKDLGTIPVMAFSLPNIVAFYPDGAWWIPCAMEMSAGLLGIADSLGVDESFCPVRAMLGAFANRAHFPVPDLLTCSVGATCDDFSAIAQRLEHLGFPIHWWEIPHRRQPAAGESFIKLPGGFAAPLTQLSFVKTELLRIRKILEDLSEAHLSDAELKEGIRKTNRVRSLLAELRVLTYTAERCPMPALEMLLAEMLAIHFCSDREEAIRVLEELLWEARRRVMEWEGVLETGAVRVFWVNPVADWRAMNILEECGGRICGTEYLFSHALDEIPENIPPMDALAQMALADPMIGPASDRAERIISDVHKFNSEAVVISRIPGASHCAYEGQIIAETIRESLSIPVVEIEVPPLCDSLEQTLRTRLQALVETVRSKQ